jgi:hypothetical protein
MRRKSTSMARRKSNGTNNDDQASRVALSPAQHIALNAVAQTLPTPRRYSFLLATMVALRRGDTDHGAVSDQLVQQAIGHALEQRA